ncbi:MAG: methyltransferase family protein [Solirubrobacterales bacterium]
MGLESAADMILTCAFALVSVITLLSVDHDYQTQKRLTGLSTTLILAVCFMHIAFLMNSPFHSFDLNPLLISLLFAAGIVFALGGVWLCLVGGLRIGSTQAIFGQTAEVTLCTDRIYRYSRHPQYLGYNLFALGLALVWQSPISFVITLLVWVYLHLMIIFEERYLLDILEDPYTEYIERTPRYWNLGQSRQEEPSELNTPFQPFEPANLAPVEKNEPQ